MKLKITNGIAWGISMGGDYPNGLHITWFDLWENRFVLEIVFRDRAYLVAA